MYMSISLIPLLQKKNFQKEKTSISRPGKAHFKIIVAIRHFLPTYVCELTFSSMVDIETKKINALELENYFIVNISKIKARFENFWKNKQTYPSH